MRRSIRPVAVLTILLICAGLVLWHNRAASRGAISAPESGTLLLLRLPQRAFWAVASWVTDVGRVMVRRGDIIGDNRKMRERIADLEGTSQRLQRYQRENEELRRLMSMPKPPGAQSVAADVVSYDATDYSRKIFINAGTERSVKSKDVVYTAHGLVGQVVRAGPRSADVLLLTDRLSGVGAMTARTQAKGVVQGMGGNTCRMKYFNFNADVRAGDLVVTSGTSGQSFFPKGMIIGRVLKVEKNKTYSSMTADIDPAVPFDQISAVWVRARAVN